MVNPNSTTHFPFPKSPKLTALFRGRTVISKRAEEEDERDTRNGRTNDFGEQRIAAARSVSPCVRENPGLSPSFQYVGSALVDSGVRCQNQGDFQKALKHFNSALKMQRLHIRASDNTCIAHTLSNLGALQLQKGELSHAKIALKEAARMIIRLRTRNPSDPNPELIILSDTLVNLGNIAFMQAEFTDSMRYYEEACKEIRIRPPTISTRRSLADVLYNVGRIHILNHDWELAMAAVEESHQLLCQIYGDDDVETVDSLNLIGFVQLCSSSFTAASESFTRGLWINVRFYGPDHPEVAASWFNIATVQAARGDLMDALMACATSREMYNQARLPRNPELIALAKLEREIRELANKSRNKPAK